MAFRRAIETYSEERRLNQDLSDYLDAASGHLWQAPTASDVGHRNAQQSR
jgi:hypothetical protein